MLPSPGLRQFCQKISDFCRVHRGAPLATGGAPWRSVGFHWVHVEGPATLGGAGSWGWPLRSAQFWLGFPQQWSGYSTEVSLSTAVLSRVRQRPGMRRAGARGRRAVARGSARKARGGAGMRADAWGVGPGSRPRRPARRIATSHEPRWWGSARTTRGGVGKLAVGLRCGGEARGRPAVSHGCR